MLASDFHLHEGEERDFRPLKKTSLLQMIEPELHMIFPPCKSHFWITFFPLLSQLPVGFYPVTLLSSAVIRNIITSILMIEPDLLTSPFKLFDDNRQHHSFR